MEQGQRRDTTKRRIDRVVEKLTRPNAVPVDIDAAYRATAADEDRERVAMEWAEGLVGDWLPKSQDSR